MKVHLITVSLFAVCCYLFYLIIFGLKDDLAGARNTIRKESVASATNNKKIQNRPELKTYINKALAEAKPASSIEEPSPMTSDSRVTELPSEAPAQIDGAFRSSLEEKDYWCRNTALNLEGNPAKCVYADACFGCKGAIIPPEITQATPLCADGSESNMYHVECCPFYGSEGASCPSVEACFNAESVPSDGCSCNDRADCKLVQIHDKIECSCAN